MDMFGFLKQALSGVQEDTRAAFAPVSAFIILGAFGVFAITIDGNTVRNARLELSAVADASALAGVKALAANGSPADDAIALARQNLPPAKYGEVLTAPNVEVGQWNAATKVFTVGQSGANAVRVTLELSAENGNALPLSMAGVLGFNTADVSATAIATMMERPLCVLALDDAGYGVSLEQNNDLTAADCTVWSNADHSQSIAITGSSSFFDTGSTKACAAGLVYADPADISIMPHQNCAEKPDPLANHVLPVDGGSCLETNLRILANEVYTFSPGVYCGGVTIQPNAGENDVPLTFQPGVYVFTGGDLHIRNNNEIFGEDVIFHFTDGAGFVIESNVEVELTGRESGAYAGLVVTQDELSPGTFDFSSNLEFHMEGVVYLPASTLTIGADTQVSMNSPWIALIVKELRMIANADILLNDDYAGSSVPYPPSMAQMFATLVE